MIPYRAMLDVPAKLVRYLSRLLAAERRHRGTPAGSRKLTCRDQAVLALRWFRDRTRIERLGRDHGVSRATAYRYVDGLGDEGARIGILTPVKRPSGNQEPDIDTRTRNALLRDLRCRGERGFALLTQRWAALQHITADPDRTTEITRAALVLTQFEHKYIG